MAHSFLFTRSFVLTVLACIVVSYATGQDSLHYPLRDRRGDQYTWQNRNTFDFRDTSLIKQDIEYDPKTKQFYIIEKIGKTVYRKPTSLTFEEFYKLQARRDEINYFNQRSKTLSLLNRKVQRPKLRTYERLFDRIFGFNPNAPLNSNIDIKPQGTVDILFGYQGQNIKNPTLPERARRNGGFDFDMNANISVVGKIGDKLQLPINYNTLANFDFENQLKFDYKGKDDEIIKSIEAGNINFQSKGTLIPSAQALFGAKAQLQFGKLFVTAAIANQKSSKQSVALKGGGVAQQINKKLDDYEENRHFLLAQYFRNNYNKAMSILPVVQSQVQITRMEVWVTNRNGAVTETRDIVGFADLAESQPYNPIIQAAPSNNNLPNNYANDLYPYLTSDQNNRNPSLINSRLVAKGFKPVEDYEKTFARKLNPSEFYYNQQIGFLSLNQQLQPDEVLAVAYEYTFNGKSYKVGEFSQDVALDSTKGVQKVLFLKLLKATSQRTQLPLWDLMMKNVYSLDVAGLQPQDFKLNILFEEPGGGLKRYLPEASQAVEGRTLISLLNADRLNDRNDPLPNGNYDYIEGFTVLSQLGKIVFPVLEPFGKDLDSVAYQGMPQSVKDKYVFYQLYDSIKAIAQTYANLNRYVAQGEVKASTTSEIYLGAFNVPQGSVTVTAGGTLLREGVDYSIDYNLGTIRILNQAIINSGVPVNVQFENNAGFGMQQRSFLGLRFDYLAKNTAKEALTIGGSLVRLSERPFFTKMNYGEDPIRNSMYGLDFSYRTQLPGMTRFLNKLPFYNSTSMSTLTAYGEAAMLKPGHPKQIGEGAEGLIYIDDFEGTRNNIDLRFPFISWTLASTPQGNGLFPESVLTDSVDYGKNRAKLAWYNIEPVLQDPTNSSNPLRADRKKLSDPRVRQVFTNELFPQRTTNITDVQQATFDLAYYPTERGPYNFETSPLEITNDGKLRNPRKRWGGIMRNIDQTDFETGNVEFIEFWTQDPFIGNPTSAGGKLIINLGNVSEDVLKDGKRFYENGLNTPKVPAAVDSATTWGKVPVNPIQITQAFSNDPDDRPYQDVGFDGLNDVDEQRKRNHFLTQLRNVVTAQTYAKYLNDPSSDNYMWYRDDRFTASDDILSRYKNFNNPQGNSPVANNSSQFSPAATLYPDNEDLNRDNTLNETEQYYEYQVDLKPGMNVGLTKYITDVRLINPKLVDGTSKPENWYLFRIPIRDFTSRVGNIPDFKSIRFIRLYMTDFQDSVVMRFAKFDLVRNQWRNFNYQLDTTGSYIQLPQNSPTTLNTLAVNLEENSNRQPVNYKIPPGIERVQILSNNGVNLLQNEQAMSLKVANLQPKDARAVFKTLNWDFRQYGQLSMFVHAESVPNQPAVKDGELYAVIRLGQDMLSNYYEVKVPLKITPFNTIDPEAIWPAVNNLDFNLKDLIDLKLRRNSKSLSISKIYRETIGNKTYSVFGNPNLGELKAILIGVENAGVTNSALNAEVWVNELRLSKLDEQGGWAALGRLDVQLADLGTATISANTYTKGFGTIEQRVNERAREDLVQFDAAISIDAGKLLPKSAGVSLPVYASLNKTVRTPEYDPYDKDVKYKDKLNSSKNKDSVRNAALDQMTVTTLNFTNVRFGTNNTKNKLWSISNFDFSYSFTKIDESTPLILKNEIVRHKGGFGYTYNGKPKYIEPFKKMMTRSSNWFNLIKDFNVNYVPSLIGFRADVNRQFGEFVPRIVNSYDNFKVDRVDTTFDKYFSFDRYYNLRWDVTRSLNLDFSAVNNARVDEPYGRLDTKAKRDTVRENFLKGGRNVLYNQRAALTYTLPLSKLPITDWINATYNYKAAYNWIGASRLAVNLGNIIENEKGDGLTAEFDFTRLYNKSKFFRSLDEVNTENSGPKPVLILPSKENATKGLSGKAKDSALAKWRSDVAAARKTYNEAKAKQKTEVGGALKAVGKFFTLVKRGSLNYTETYRSRVPGYTDSTQVIGQNFRTMQPGLDYVFGRQPDTNWLNQKAREGVITRDPTFNLLFRQSFEQKLSLNARLEPFREFSIDLNMDRTFTKDYSELFKDTIGTGNFSHLSPYANGGFSVSYISFKTLFKPFKPNEVSETFKVFEQNRLIVSNRLAQTNPYWQQLPAAQKFGPDGFATGYGRYSQDVLIPAFLAAYSGKDPNGVALINQSNSDIKSNPFSGIKSLPNWRVSYTGLTRIPALAKTFSAITLAHGYNGTLSMNSFTSALQFRDPFRYGTPGFIDTVSGNYVPFFLVPNLTMSEQFAPLISLDVTTTNQLNLRFEYRKSRTLSLSLIDYQLSEQKSTEWVVGTTFRKRGFTLPFKLPFMKGKKLENDLNFRLDLSMRDDAQSNSRLDQANAYSTGGQKVITIQPSIDYILNNRVNVKLFFDQRRVIPYISTSAPITNTRAGVQIRVSLAQ